MAKVEWDYSERAAHYDKRADYSLAAIQAAIAKMALETGNIVADIGAGTGKLSVPLARCGFVVKAVEPNTEMRRFGCANTAGLSVSWTDGTGETTGLPSSSVNATFFGSSFNVVDQQGALAECARLLLPRGWFCCMWNHRDLDDQTQARIEEIIKDEVPNYQYGKRREDPTDEIRKSGRFGPVLHVEQRFEVDMARDDVIEAWRSHATLARQAGARFPGIIDRLEQILSGRETIRVPYHTRIWFAQKARG